MSPRFLFVRRHGRAATPPPARLLALVLVACLSPLSSGPAAATAGGQVDPAFGDEGLVVLGSGAGEDKAYAMALQVDGRVVRS